MKYIEEYSMGYDAGLGDEPASANPHVWHSVAWWAWHAGWVAGTKDLDRHYDEQGNLIAEDH